MRNQQAAIEEGIHQRPDLFDLLFLSSVEILQLPSGHQRRCTKQVKVWHS